ncbi:HDIG domain-containing protein [Akkermansiaceae bacterium]|nr:HDIG domain-containing protein [Akkermansiaceae bacterium]
MAGYLTRIVILGLVDQIRRWRLVQKGLSSGKKRRTSTDGGALAAMDSSLIVRGALYVGFSLGMFALFSGVQHNDSRAAEAVVILICGLAIFHLNHQQSAGRNGRVLLVFGGILIHLWLVKLANGVALKSDLGEHYEFLVMPIALAPMVHSVLLGQRAGVYSSVFVSLFGALTIPSDDRWAFFAISLICGLTSVFATKRVSKRGRLLRTGFWVGVMALLVDLVFAKISVSGLQMFSGESWTIFGKACLIALSTGLLTGLFVGGVLPLLEGLFGLTTEISWLELSDLNHPLLRKMQIEAPGTFHHSLIVASLAESAAEAIGANAVMSRVCAYFHDIGKLNKPEYFIENQGGMNPHDGLTPTMSALIIVAHVKDGVDLAIKNKLNPRILDVIQEHHGDSLVYYFYRKAQERLQKHEVEEDHGKTDSDDLPNVDEKSFRYPGPIPQTRESGIISLADAIESASRTISKPSPSRIRALVDEIVFKRVRDGQLDATGLTMTDLTIIRKIFASTLRSMLHARIEYPKEQIEDAPSDLSRKGGKSVSAEEIEKVRRRR